MENDIIIGIDEQHITIVDKNKLRNNLPYHLDKLHRGKL